MYKGKVKNPKYIIMRPLNDETERLDYLCQFFEVSERSAMIRSLINGAYDDLKKHVDNGVYFSDLAPAPETAGGS